MRSEFHIKDDNFEVVLKPENDMEKVIVQALHVAHGIQVMATGPAIVITKRPEVEPCSH